MNMNEHRRYTLYLIVLLLLSFGCQSSKTDENNSNRTNDLPHIMNMVHPNPGEGETQSIYNDPWFVKSRGFGAMVLMTHAQCAINYDNFEKDVVPQGPERDWITAKSAIVDEKLQAADSAGIDVYAFTDVFVAPKAIWDRYGEEMGMQETDFHGYGGDVKNVRKPNIQFPIIQKLMRAQIEGIFERFPSLDGLVIRFGETYLHDTPYHMGGKLVRQGDEGILDHVFLINLLREEVCVKRNKKLFYRTWDFGWMHTEPEIYTAITDQVKPHPNLIFSIKHTKGDFLRTFPFNPTLGKGKHKQLVEVQSQREYEGKGAHPNYIAEAVINGFEEYEGMNGMTSLSDLKGHPNFSGVWTWARGGGWKGPYITNELWCDLNTYVISQWAQDTTRNESEIFTEYTHYLGLSAEDAKVFREIALLSNRGVFLGRTSHLAHINPWWIRDEFMGGITSTDFNDHQEAWGRLNEDFKNIVNQNLVDGILEEKQQAVNIWKKIENLSQTVTTGDEQFKDYLKVSSTYGRIKYEIIQQAWIVMLRGMEGEKNGVFNIESIMASKHKYDELWEEFKALKSNNIQCATLYKPYSFMLGNVDLHGEEGMQKSVNRYFSLISEIKKEFR